MDISVEGRVVERGLNVAVAAGGPNRPLQRSYVAAVRDGVVDIQLAGVGGRAAVMAACAKLEVPHYGEGATET